MTRITDGLPGVVTPILAADLLGRIHLLNVDYLELLIGASSGADDLVPGPLPARVLATLRQASVDTRQRVAATAFTLYSLGFEDQSFWRAALSDDCTSIGDRYSAVCHADSRVAFCELALLHAWHVAVLRPIAARVMYGMPQPTVEAMARARLWQLRRVAMDFPNLLMPRWPANPCFWPEMLKFAAAGDTRRLHTLQQLGHQLIAVDLQTSDDKRSPIRARQCNLLKQRLARPRGAP